MSDDAAAIGLMATTSVLAGIFAAHPKIVIEEGKLLLRDAGRIGHKIMSPIIKVAKHPTTKAIKVRAIRGEAALLGAELLTFPIAKSLGVPTASNLGGTIREGIVKPAAARFGSIIRAEWQAGGLRRAQLVAAGGAAVVLAVASAPALITAAATAKVGIPLLGIGILIATGEGRSQDRDLFF